ncbi:MAG: hypothetical protein VB036_11090, partial [Propionicimonas sp.]|nr:hypothetical protein [Propionicimonas sp.]
MSAVAELATLVVTPATDGAVLGQRAGVVYTGGDLHNIDQAGDLDRSEAVGGGPVAQLAMAVVAPAADGALVGECTGVIASCTDLGDAAGCAG